MLDNKIKLDLSSPFGEQGAFSIAVIPGDGIGPEVTQQSVKILNAVAERFDHEFNYT